MNLNQNFFEWILVTIILNLNKMNAFYLIDKPLGITSFDVIRILRKKLNIKRI